ncbi:hypothetical protein DRQ18_07070 [bacterium]|mgnify:CR=1 FL=1|nr:MAG: hypothetical protein DRQ18_07070 [bacterium]
MRKNDFPLPPPDFFLLVSLLFFLIMMVQFQSIQTNIQKITVEMVNPSQSRQEDEVFIKVSGDTIYFNNTPMPFDSLPMAVKGKTVFVLKPAEKTPALFYLRVISIVKKHAMEVYQEQVE